MTPSPTSVGSPSAARSWVAATNFVRRAHLHAEVVERTGVRGVLEEDQFEGRVGDGEVGVPGAPLGGLSLEELCVQGDRLIEIGHVQRTLDPSHLSSIHSRTGRIHTGNRSS